MPGAMLDKLLILQDRDSGIRRMMRELQDIPRRKAEVEKRLEEHRLALKAAKDGLAQQQSNNKQFELEIASRRERIGKLRGQQLTLRTNDDFRTMEGEIKTVEVEISKIEDQEIGLMDVIAAAQTAIREKEQSLREEEALVRRDQAAMEERAARMQGELSALKTERAGLAEAIDRTWLARYERIFENKKDVALVSIDHGVCSGCHMKLPPQVYHDAQKENAMVFCNYCGRMLYNA